MNAETYIRKNFRHRSDRAMATTLCTTAKKIAMIRQELGLVREVSKVNRQDLTWLTPFQMRQWYRGKFNVRETNWEFSGRTK